MNVGHHLHEGQEVDKSSKAVLNSGLGVDKHGIQTCRQSDNRTLQAAVVVVVFTNVSE